MKNEINVSFCICEFNDITHEEISKELGLIPCDIFSDNKTLSKKYESKWIYGTPYGNMGNFDEQMGNVLDALEPKVSLLQKFAKKYICKFRIVIFLRNREESTPWVYLDKRYNAFIKQLDITLDIEVYTPEFNIDEYKN